MALGSWGGRLTAVSNLKCQLSKTPPKKGLVKGLGP